MPDQGGPAVCFSYLAAASLWQVERFPTANSGVEVELIEESIAADGPMVAAVLAALSQPSLLLSNGLGDDRPASAYGAVSSRTRCRRPPGPRPSSATPRIVVVSDNHHSRTVFAYLPGVADELEGIDLAALRSASFAYIDGYKKLGKAAAPAVQTATAAQVPLLVNLGGDLAPSELLHALDGYPSLIAQTSIAEESLETVIRLIRHMQPDMHCEWVVITAGRAEAAAASRGRSGTRPSRAPLSMACFTAGICRIVLNSPPSPARSAASGNKMKPCQR